ERQGRHDRLLLDRRVPDGRGGARASGIRGDERAGIRRRRRTGRPVLRAGQLVPRRRDADAVHRLALRRAEPGATDVPAGDVTRGSDSRLEVVRPRRARAAGRLVEGAVAPAGAGHPQERRRRARNDPAWYRGGLYHDDQKLNVPGLWFMSWYDVSVGPNLALYNHVRSSASPGVRDQQWAVIAPVAHCSFTRATDDTIVGERSMGDARLDYNDIVYGFFDRFLKGDARTRLDTLPKVTYFTMGSNQWQTSDTWPPAGAQSMAFYLSSGGRANTLYGDGMLAAAAPDTDKPDAFTYDPMNPVTSYGGNVCCTGTAVQAGAFDQRRMEARDDILVYTSEPFKEATEISGPI